MSTPLLFWTVSTPELLAFCPDSNSFCLCKSFSSTSVVYLLIVHNLGFHLEMSGGGMSIRKETYYFITKVWYVFFPEVQCPPVIDPPSKRIFTECDVSDPKDEEEVIFCAMTLIEQAIRTSDAILDELTEIVLNVDDTRRWHYYFVDHTRRLLFWVDQVSVDELGAHLQGITKHSHISMCDSLQLSRVDRCLRVFG